MLTAAGPAALAQGSLYLEPVVGTQWTRGRLSEPAPQLRNEARIATSLGVQLRYRPALSSRLELAAGATYGSAAVYLLASVPPDRLQGGQAAFGIRTGVYNDVWHYSAKAGIRLADWFPNPANPKTPALRLALVLGPQLSRLGPVRDNWQLNEWAYEGNSAAVRPTALRSARWGASLYGAVQLRYLRRGQERLVLSLYGIQGLRDMRTFHLDYTLNGTAYSATAHARTTAIGWSLGVPVTIYSARPSAAP